MFFFLKCHGVIPHFREDLEILGSDSEGVGGADKNSN